MEGGPSAAQPPWLIVKFQSWLLLTFPRARTTWSPNRGGTFPRKMPGRARRSAGGTQDPPGAHDVLSNPRWYVPGEYAGQSPAIQIKNMPGTARRSESDGYKGRLQR